MSAVLPKAVRELSVELTRLPGIGPKTAQRLALHLLRQQRGITSRLAETIATLHDRVQTCSVCFSLADEAMCAICKDTTRTQNILCVVEDPLDVEAIERTGTYRGLYHVLGGVLSPMEGVGAEQLTLNELIKRVQDSFITEVIIALEHNMEGEATTRHIISYLKNTDASVTRLARGLPTGGDIEFADALTLTAAFSGRTKM
ncbi:MAG: recombination protein RecR [Candidatus Andersenbacteria bacterium RIFCSPHIGHO2_02_FULL_45_11]|uniref:Recombination protein RecR n=1 Tax=Candidatus Andersenbacteria bacterium RIFCSPHIGHO2_12_FULL_45_11 TaxID=1797281 RepID=A0A1G1X3J9_9BACT|nr:MAG: recombination protein RecR [Candidatus Andersenbacteria bacterium RIFCSPHIGHO2_01_FULL_46_36]OGY32532.1 MAG: recombination protein RecR [Candidatus Andersenbacteria bacterium RIFCSPHIGHO2_02_FULL_45_11]OGY33917.1 MAG: recombination protein RecR [Candidatus Andersenbacteria bacterium RIFCSPHIGHO2_12_FULL_45_11]